MDSKTKNGLIASGAVIGLIGVLYLLFRKPPTYVTNTTVFGDKETGGGSSTDPYFMVDNNQKLKEIKQYVADQAGYDPNSDFNKMQTKYYKETNNMEWQPYWWPDVYARTTQNGINAWYYAIQKKQPTFTFYVDQFRKNYECTTKDGKWTGKS
jgi:hypothetical protein